MANFAVPFDFISVVCDRLVASRAPAAERHAALAVLGVVIAELRPQSYACRLSLPDLAARLAMTPAELVAAVRLLGSVGAVVLSDRRGGGRCLAVLVPGGLRRGPPRHYPGAEIAIGARTFAA